MSAELEQFLGRERDLMVSEFKRIIRKDRAEMKRNPELYKESSDEAPSIDIRLCVDEVETNSNQFSLMSPLESSFTWCLRTGSADYDQRHSKYCGASSYGADTDPAKLWKDLAGQILEQEANYGE